MKSRPVYPSSFAALKKWIGSRYSFKMFLLGCLALFVPAVGLAASTALDRLTSFFDNDNTFFGEFYQVVLDEGLNTVEESSGLLWLARPDKFRWEYKSPFQQTIVSDGKSVWVYDNELEQVSISNSESMIGDTPAMLLAGKGAIDNEYVVTDLGTQGNFEWVAIEPRDLEKSQFEVMRLAFGENGLAGIDMIGLLGNATRIQFLDTIRNPKLDENTFEFEIPEGVDVIRTE